MTAETLMREADRLSGARPSMTSAEVSSCFAGLTKDVMLARHRINAINQAPPGDGETRGKLAEAIYIQAAEKTAVHRMIKKEFPGVASVTAPRTRKPFEWGRAGKPGRPRLSETEKLADTQAKKHAKAMADRERARAYRERRKGR